MSEEPGAHSNCGEFSKSSQHLRAEVGQGGRGKRWYGMPAYAKDGKVVCFFLSAHKFEAKYATFGFSDEANLDEGSMWLTAFALKEFDCRQRGKDRRARVESGESRTELAREVQRLILETEQV